MLINNIGEGRWYAALSEPQFHCVFGSACAHRDTFSLLSVSVRKKSGNKKKIYIQTNEKYTKKWNEMCSAEEYKLHFQRCKSAQGGCQYAKKKKENKTKNSTAHCNWNRTSTQQLLRCFDVFFFSFIFLLEMKIYCTDSHSNSNLYSYFIRIFQNCLILTLKLLCAVARAQVRMFAIAFSIAANNVDANIGAIRCHTRAGQYPAKE